MPLTIRARRSRISMSILRLTSSELKAIRQGLGLTVKEASELAAINVSKRAFQYWESGSRSVPDDVSSHFSLFTTHYSLLLERLKADIEAFKANNPIPKSDDSAQYFINIKNTKKLALPFFTEFDDFKLATGNEHVINWRLWQSVISHLFMEGLVANLDDDAAIPKDFTAWWWLRGDYDVANDF